MRHLWTSNSWRDRLNYRYSAIHAVDCDNKCNVWDNLIYIFTDSMGNLRMLYVVVIQKQMVYWLNVICKHNNFYSHVYCALMVHVKYAHLCHGHGVAWFLVCLDRVSVVLGVPPMGVVEYLWFILPFCVVAQWRLPQNVQSATILMLSVHCVGNLSKSNLVAVSRGGGGITFLCLSPNKIAPVCPEFSDVCTVRSFLHPYQRYFGFIGGGTPPCLPPQNPWQKKL